MPALSVLMPVHNTARFVARSIRSILNQTFADFEFVIIDDGSRDNSVELIKKIAAKDGRIRFLPCENRGLVEVRNALLHEARCELVAWADSDDLYAPDRLEKQLRKFRREPDLVACGTAWQLIDARDFPIKSLSFPESHDDIVRTMRDVDNAIWFPTVMMNRKAALAVGGFRHPFVIAEDYDIHLRLAEFGRVANLPDLLCYYRQHLASTVNSRHWQAPAYAGLARELAHERLEHGSDRLQRGEKIDLAFDPPLSRSESISHLRMKWGWWALMDGHIRTARRIAMINTAQRPANIESWRLLFCALRGH